MEVKVGVPGAHNVENAGACLEACFQMGVAPDAATWAISTFTGTRRRFQRLGEFEGADVYSDYAHHPTAIAAAIATARLQNPRMLVVIFEPWGSQRTCALSEDFGKALSLADLIVLLPHAGTVDDQFVGQSTSRIVDAVRRQSSLCSISQASDYDEARLQASEHLREGAICLVLGCGPVENLALELSGTKSDT
jgi:UDP-N-acetylmuramate--alanine ligase